MLAVLQRGPPGTPQDGSQFACFLNDPFARGQVIGSLEPSPLGLLVALSANGLAFCDGNLTASSLSLPPAFRLTAPLLLVPSFQLLCPHVGGDMAVASSPRGSFGVGHLCVNQSLAELIFRALTCACQLRRRRQRPPCAFCIDLLGPPSSPPWGHSPQPSSAGAFEKKEL